MKLTVIAILLVAILVSATIILSVGENNMNEWMENNVSIVDGKQTITIDARGGYFPRATRAQANRATVLNVRTKGTFDCSSILVIPKLGFRSNLPLKGETLINIPPQIAGSIVKGSCAMGMYNFAIKFD